MIAEAFARILLLKTSLGITRDALIIPTNIELSGMEISLVNAMSREQTLKLYLADLKKDYDYILIDCILNMKNNG